MLASYDILSFISKASNLKREDDILWKDTRNWRAIQRTVNEAILMMFYSQSNCQYLSQTTSVKICIINTNTYSRTHKNFTTLLKQIHAYLFWFKKLKL